MPLFSFGKKEEANPQLGPPRVKGPPTDRVLDLKRKGLGNSQIIDTLQREGVDMTDIFDAMNQAEIKTGVGMGPNPGMMANEMLPEENKQFPGNNIQSIAQDYGQNQDYNDAQSMGNIGSQSGSPQIPGLERIEEIAEAIIDEKWNEIVKSINKIIDWKDRTEGRILKIEQQFVDLQKQFDTLHKGVLGRIGDYDRNLTTIGSDIQALEKVFQKVLPIMTENVNELSRITADMKQQQRP
ncbi:hypothetical protein HYY69_02490 [Candidatus Woesearchaeota archaeon]|nr:hypothetical protein [Candidatus Woesearchaeota archaeon]